METLNYRVGMNRLRPHGAALLLALTLGIFVSGILSFGERSAPHFSGIATPHLDDQLYYLARAHDVLDGHPMLSNPYFAEHKDLPPLQVWLPDYLLAVPLGWLSIPVAIGYVVYAGLCAAILFLLTYANTYLLTRSRLASVLTAVFIHVGTFGIALARIPSPGFNFVAFEALLCFLLLYLQSGRRRFAVLAALSLGSLFYLYPYFWTFWVAGLGVFLIGGYVTKIPIRARGVLGVSLAGCVLGAQYIWTTLQAGHRIDYMQTVERIGLVHTHFPSGFLIVGLGLLTLGVTGLALKKRFIRGNATTLLLVSLSIAAIVAVNQHLVTGQNIEFSSHYQLPSVYVFTLTGAYLLSQRARMRVRRVRGVSVLVLIVVALYAVHGAYQFVTLSLDSTPEDAAIQAYTPIFNWLSAHTQRDSVVFANELVSQYIPVYTSNNVYDSGYGILFFLSNGEAEQRFIINHYWSTFTPAYIAEHERSIFGAGYLDAYAHQTSENTVRTFLRLPPRSVPRISPDAIERVMTEAKTLQEEPFSKALATYRADYIVWDTVADPSWRIDRYPFATLKYRSGAIAIYAVDARP